jgi:serine/threonine protein kinase
MNYEEMLETRDVRRTTKVRLPYGYFYKRLIDGKYSNFVEFHDEVADAITFSKSVTAEHEALAEIHSKLQLHYTPNEGDDGIYAIAVEVGNYVTIEQVLNENPSMVAKGDFVTSTLRDLFNITEELHAHNIFHVCYAPSNILARKSDSSIRLLCHGSFYEKIGADILYDGLEDFIAPEVMAGGCADARSDVFSIGSFIAWIYQSSGLPFELKHIVEKATAESPDDRYQTAEDMRQAINKIRSVRKTGTIAVAALAIALCIVGFYFYLMPSPEPVEYVAPVDDPIPADLLEENMDDYIGLGEDLDSATIAAIVGQEKSNDTISADEKKMRLYNAKAEAIFRKQFAKEADIIISRVYNTESMNGEQKVFAAKTQQMTEDLAKKQQELAKLTNLSSDRTQAIAAEIIEKITNKKMAAMDKDYLGLRPAPDEKTTTTPKSDQSSSPTTTLPTTTTSTPSTSTSSQSESSKTSIYDRYRDKYGQDPLDPIEPDKYRPNKK